MLLGKLNYHMQKIETTKYFTQYLKYNSKWINELDARSENIKYVKENIADHYMRNICKKSSPVARKQKENVNTWDNIKLKCFCRVRQNNQDEEIPY